MYLIEPCCAQRHLRQVRSAIGKNGTAEIEGFGDLSLTELLPALLARYGETEMLIAAPSLPDQAAGIIRKWMGQQWARMDGKGKMDVISHLTIVAGLSRRKSPMASQWKKENPFGDRLTLINRQQSDTVILLPDLAVTGPVNMRYGEHFVATVTTVPSAVAALWKQYATAEEQPEQPESEKETVPAPEPAAVSVTAPAEEVSAPEVLNNETTE